MLASCGDGVLGENQLLDRRESSASSMDSESFAIPVADKLRKWGCETHGELDRQGLKISFSASDGYTGYSYR